MFICNTDVQFLLACQDFVLLWNFQPLVMSMGAAALKISVSGAFEVTRFGEKVFSVPMHRHEQRVPFFYYSTMCVMFSFA